MPRGSKVRPLIESTVQVALAIALEFTPSEAAAQAFALEPGFHIEHPSGSSVSRTASERHTPWGAGWGALYISLN